MLRLALPILLLLPAAASAQWSPPEALGAGAAPRVAVSGDGTRQVAWTTDGERVVVNGRCVAANAGWLTGPVAYGRRGFATAWTGSRQRRAYVRVGSATRRIASGRRIASLRLAGNAAGTLALAWFDDRGTDDDAVMVAVRAPGRPFGRPRRIARGAVRGVSVAVGPQGRVLVAWNTRRRVHARMLGGRAETIRSLDAHAARLHTAVLDGGAVVAWTAKRRSEGGDAGDAFVQVATRALEERRFRPAQLLARHDGAESELRIEHELGALAWSTPEGIFHTSMEDGAYVLPAVRSEPAGAELEDLEGPQTAYLRDGRLHVQAEPVSEPGAVDADLARDPESGRLIAVWVQDGQVMTSTRD